MYSWSDEICNVTICHCPLSLTDSHDGAEPVARGRHDLDERAPGLPLGVVVPVLLHLPRPLPLPLGEVGLLGLLGQVVRQWGVPVLGRAVPPLPHVVCEVRAEAGGDARLFAFDDAVLVKKNRGEALNSNGQLVALQ